MSIRASNRLTGQPRVNYATMAGGRGQRGQANADSDEDGEQEPNVNQPGALTPGQAFRGTLDYVGNKAHYYIYKNATAQLEVELYDCTPDTFFQFIKSLEERADEYGWNDDEGGILWMPDENGEMINLLKNYGSITLERIREHELTYWDDRRRKSQEDRMLYECIMNSLSLVGKTKLNIHYEDYKLGPKRIPSGLCLLKVLVRESYLDSNATTGMIREQLAGLETFMPQVANDITKFNNHVKMLLHALHARGERTLDLLTYLFRAYAACRDREFVKFIRDIQTDHDMGKESVTASQLMQQAEKKYKILVTTQKWEAPTAVDEQLMALQAKIADMKSRYENKKKRKPGDTKPDEGRGKRQKYDKNKKKPEWLEKHKPPAKQKMKEPRTWNGTKWYWCSKETGGKCDGKWRAHKPQECKGTARKTKPTEDASKEKQTAEVEIKVAEIEGGYISDE